MENEIKVGSFVQCGIYRGADFVPMAKGTIVKDRNGYYEVDIMSHHGGAPWIVSYGYSEVKQIEQQKERKPMTELESQRLQIKGLISELPPEDAEATLELAKFIGENRRNAGDIVGGLALALAGIEAQIVQGR